MRVCDIQDRLNSLNGCSTPKLKISDVSGEFDSISDFLRVWLKNKTLVFKSHRSIIHPNIIKLFLSVGKGNFTFNSGMFEYINEALNFKLIILKQYKFTYDLFLVLYTNKKIKKIYFKDGYISTYFFSIEKICSLKICDDITKYYLDISLKFSDTFQIAIEYNEDYHNSKAQEVNDSIRFADLTSMCDIKKIFYVWEQFYYNDTKKILDFIINEIIKYINIEDEEKFIINRMNNDIDNINFTKAIYYAYNNKNKCELEESYLKELFEGNYIKKGKFKKLVKEYLLDKEHCQESDNDIIDISDDDEDDINNSDDIITDEIRDGKRYYSYNGLVDLISSITRKMATGKQLMSKKLFLRNVLSGMIEGIRELFNTYKNDKRVWGRDYEDYKKIGINTLKPYVLKNNPVNNPPVINPPVNDNSPNDYPVKIQTMIDNGDLSELELNTMVFSDNHFTCDCGSEVLKEYKLGYINKHIGTFKHKSFFNK